MGFRFRLETILRLRQGLERKQLHQLQKAATALRNAVDREEQLERVLRERLQGRERSLAGADADARALFVEQSCFEWSLAAYRESLLQRAARYSEWEAQLLEFRSRKMDTEKLLSAKEVAQRAFEADERRREQAELDALYALRRSQRSG